jgi:hypothetical protein
VATQRAKERRKRTIVNAKQMADTSTGFVSKALHIPRDVEQIQVDGKTDVYEWNVIPHEITSKHNPHGSIGNYAAWRLYHVHSRIGPNGDTFGCNAKNFSDSCPVCEARQRLLKEGMSYKDDEVKALNAKRRIMMWVNPNGTQDCKFLEYSAFLFTDFIDAKIDKFPKYVNFTDPDEGYMLQIGVTEKKEAGFNAFYQLSDIEFKERKPIPESVMDKATTLDDYIVRADYDELKRLLELGDTPPEEQQERGQNGEHRETTTQQPDEQPQDGDTDFRVDDEVHHNDLGDCKVVRVSNDGELLTLEDSKGVLHRAVSADECDLLLPDDDQGQDNQPAAGVIEVGVFVTHKKHGLCEVVKLTNGLAVLEDKSGELYNKIPLADLTLKEESKPAEQSNGKGDKRDVPFQEEEPNQRPTGRSTSASGGKSTNTSSREEEAPSRRRAPRR